MTGAARMADVQTFGPKKVFEGRIERFEYYAEARGADGRSYYVTGRSRPTDDEQVKAGFLRQTAELLEDRMKEEGVWDE